MKIATATKTETKASTYNTNWKVGITAGGRNIDLYHFWEFKSLLAVISWKLGISI
jgi:hypothetical protein